MKIQVEYIVKSVVKSLPDDIDVEALGIDLQLKSGSVELPNELNEDSKVPMSVNLMEDDGSHIDTIIL